MKLIIGNTEFWVKGDEGLLLNFDSMSDYEKWGYICGNDLLHREDGPAIIYSTGLEEWWVNGELHRLDGPAIFSFNGTNYPNGNEKWYLNDILVDGRIYRKIQNSLKEDLLVYMIDPEYRRYLPLIEHRLNQ